MTNSIVKNLNDIALVNASKKIGDAHSQGYCINIDAVKIHEFAEVIVKECIDIISKTKDQAIDESWNVDEAFSMAVMDLKEYFGVN